MHQLAMNVSKFWNHQFDYVSLGKRVLEACSYDAVDTVNKSTTPAADSVLPRL